MFIGKKKLGLQRKSGVQCTRPPMLTYTINDTMRDTYSQEFKIQNITPLEVRNVLLTTTLTG